MGNKKEEAASKLNAALYLHLRFARGCYFFNVRMYFTSSEIWSSVSLPL
jgi:hypothetical protein